MKKILVVEDDLALSAGLCFELDSGGYLTVAAYNCQKARQLLSGDHFDLALLDVNLPDGNGFDLCREIKAQHPELPVIFLTANDLETDVLNGFDMGAEDYVTKPFNMQILLRRVEVALRRASSTPAAPQADRWSDGWLTLDFSALTALRGEEKLAIVLGTEGDGLARETIAGCDYTVRIPMARGVDSLNVAAASAVAFWELRAR